MTSWCQKRITNQDLLVRFKDGKHRFYLESVCGEPILEGNVCSYCSNVKVQTRTQDVKTFPHGLVNGEYSPDSHIFDSPWYHKKVKAYGEPTKEDIELAMEAQERARAGRKTKNIAELGKTKISTSTTNEQLNLTNSTEPPKKKYTRKPKENTESKNESKTEDKPKRKYTRKPKNENTIVQESQIYPKDHTNVITVIPKTVTHVESMDDPMEVREIIKVVLKPFTHDSVTYWRDYEREKLYKRSKDGKKGDYVGRWDPGQQRIVHEAPDSDAE